MSGVLWAVIAGVGFGFFQTVNRLAVRGMDVYVATFLQLLISALILAGASAWTEDLALLWSAPVWALVDFALAGLLHFFVGWTLLNASQKRIGAARTSPLIGTTPLFGTLFAAMALREVPHAPALLGIAAVVAGVALISSTGPSGGGRVVPTPDPRHPTPAQSARLPGWTFGLGAAMLWAISPIFIRHGLAGVPSPLLAVSVGMVISTAAYGVVLLLRRRPASVPRDALLAKVVAGVLVGLSVWARWIAVALAPVGVVLALTLLSVPVVMTLSPLVAGRHLEYVTPRIWLGAACTVGGSLALVLLG